MRPYLDAAARNWGCDWNLYYSAPLQQQSGTWAKWYGTQLDNNYGCGIAWWNPKKQAAYFLPNSDRSGNVALASRGATVSASTTYSSATPAGAVIDGNRRGNPWGSGGGWSSRWLAGYPTASSPEWLQINFNGPKTISEVDVTTLQDNYYSPIEPSIGQTFSKEGIVDFTVLYWSGSSWKVMATVSSNNQVYRRVVPITPIKTQKIRINITSALDGAARVTEVEAYETNRVTKKVYDTYQIRNADYGALGLPISNPIPYDWAGNTAQLFENGRINHHLGNNAAEVLLDGVDTDTNVALAQNGGVASSSGTWPSNKVSTINDGRRASPYDSSISQYAYWASNTSATVYNCNYGNWWTRVDFIAPREISEIDLYSLQDDFANGTAPTTSTLTSSYGNVDFHLLYCPTGATCAADGSGWVEPAGGYIIGNNKALQSVSFAPVQATAVRASFDCAQSPYAYAVELEAWHRAPVTPAPANTTTPTWTATSLSTARSYHTATLLDSGRVLVVGGNSDLKSSLSSTDLYDSSTGIWSAGAPLATPRSSHTATLLPSGKVLVTGGSSAGSNGAAVNTAELYDPATNTWSATSSLATVRQKHTATLLPSGKVLVVGGTTTVWDQPVSSAELYDPQAGTWIAAGSLAHPRFDHTATLLPSGQVLVTGGWGPYGDSTEAALPTAELYDPATNSWSSTGNLAWGRRAPTATLLPSGKVLVAGGINSSRFLDAAELYDPTTGTWSMAGWLNTQRGYHKATLLPSGKVLVTGGRGLLNGADTDLTSTELYDPATNLWTWSVPLPSSRNNHTATLLSSGALLVVGGLSNGDSVASAALFGAPPSAATVESSIEVGYANPQLHTVTKSPVVFSRGSDQVIVWDRKFDGVDMLTDARSVQLPDGSWNTRFLRELNAPAPVQQANVWSFQNAALAVGLDPNKVHARLVYIPDLAQSNKVANPINATDVELVVNGYRLAIELGDDATKTITFVDAYTGHLIQTVSREKSTAAPTVKYGVVNLDTTGTPAVLRDPVRWSFINPTTFEPINGQGLVTAPSWLLTSQLTYQPLPTTADYKNDIAYGIQQSWDYFATKFGRRGLRDLPPSVVSWANDAIVYFDPSTTQTNLSMDETTGNLAVYTAGKLTWQNWVTVDVIGHEWSHAVWGNDTGHGGTYYWGSNGGLNEANSDLFGELIEARAKALAGQQPDPNTIDDGWVLGQDAAALTRKMCTPSQSGGAGVWDYWSSAIESPQLQLDAHLTMGPLIRVFCLLGRGMRANGAGNDPELQSPIAPHGFAALGADTVGRLQYQALVYLRGYPTPVSYLNQRWAMLSAATNQFGAYSPEYKAIQDAFAVILVGTPADRKPPVITLTSGTTMSTSQSIEVSVVAGNPVAFDELGAALVSNPITSVSFMLNGASLGMVTTAPWRVAAPKLAPGQYPLQVTAVDSHQNKTTSNYVLTLQDTTVPELCEIAVGPSGGPVGEVNVILTGRDDVSGLSKLDIMQVGVGWAKSDPTTAPPKVARSTMFTKTFAPGTYTFQGFCVDQSSNSASTVARSYTVGAPACNATATAGTNLIDQRVWEMGTTSGNVTLTYQTFVVHDRIKVLYQGQVIADTGCQATGGEPGGYGTPVASRQFQFSGSSSQLTVRVEPNCDSHTASPDTKWTYDLSCP